MIALLLDTLAVFRLTRLVTQDTLTMEARDAVIRGAYEAAGRAEAAGADVRHPGDWVHVVDDDPDPPKLAILITCPWCAGQWVALGVVLLRRLAPKAWAPLAEALAMSAAVGLVASNLDAE